MIFPIILSLFAAMGLGLEQPRYQGSPLGDSVDKASMKILKESFQTADDKNVIASPLGALTLLSMFSAGTDGEIRAEIMQLLGSTDYKQLQKSYSSLTNRFCSMDPSYLVFANKMYVSDQFTLNEQFSNIASQSYRSQVDQVNFLQAKTTADRINRWADENTKGHIKCAVDEDSIDKDAAVALFNVIFFQGNWKMPFDANETEDKEFYVNVSNTVKKPTMKLLDSLLYHEDAEIGARMVELPYKEKGFRMIIVLPDTRDGLAGVVEKLALKGILEDVFALEGHSQTIDFEMPKFEIDNKLNLNEILPKVGVSRIFYEGSRGVVNGEEVIVSKAFQRAFVKVDEVGATAGALTGLFLRPESLYYPPPREFKVDRPFLFAILHEDIVLFTGTYTH